MAGGLVEIDAVVNEEGTTLEYRATVIAQQLRGHVQQRVGRVALILTPIDVRSPLESQLGEMLGEGHLVLTRNLGVVTP